MAPVLRRGINLSHWLSQTKRRGPERRGVITQSDFGRIKSMGFDHVRLPVDEEHLFAEDGSKDTEAFELLDAGLDWALSLGLNVLVDLHILRSHYFNDRNTPRLYTDPAEAVRFGQLWTTLSEHLACRPLDRVAYELMNEPVARDHADWNRVFRVPLAAIRQREPQRQVVLGSNWFQVTNTFAHLDVPEDAHLTLSFHYYNPMFVTHYKAGWWDGGVYDGPIHYPGKPIADADWQRQDAAFREKFESDNSPAGPEQVQAAIELPLSVARRTGCPLYCGEFGVHNTAPLDIVRAWHRDTIAVFEANGIGWAKWDWRGNFGIVNHDGSDAGLLDVVIQR